MNSNTSSLELNNPPRSSGNSWSIRQRLTLAFLLIIFIPLFLIGVVQTVSNTLGERQRVQSELRTALDYKLNAITAWQAQLIADLNGVLIGDSVLTQIEQVLMGRTQPGTDTRIAYSLMQYHLGARLPEHPLFETFWVFDPEGNVVLSTQTEWIDQSIKNQEYFTDLISSGTIGRWGNRVEYVVATSPRVSRPVFDPETNATHIVALVPIVGDEKNVIGVLAGRANLTPLYAILNENIGLSDTGDSYLVSIDQRVLAGLDPSDLGTQITSNGLLNSIKSKSTISGQFTNLRNTPVIGVYRWIPDLQATLVAERDLSAFNRSIVGILAVNTSLTLSALVIAIVISLLITRSIALPLTELSETAGRISSGELDLEVNIKSQDELGKLAFAFNFMTAQLRSLITSLEKRVAERTHTLEERTNYLEASSQVSRTIASILDPDQLMIRSVELIRDRFNLYYAGIFLVDEAREWAILRAGTGSAGQAMLARRHRLRLDQHSMIGWCITNALARNALQAGEDPVRLATIELPDTRSEAALPLRSRGQVIGAITVQSSQPNAFNREAIEVLQTLADQLATAIENTRLFVENQAALENERLIYGQLTKESWADWIKTTSDPNQMAISFRSDQRGRIQAEQVWYPEMETALQQGRTILSEQRPIAPEGERNGGDGQQSAKPGSGAHTLTIPIKVRGNVIGVLHTHKPTIAGEWNVAEVSLMETITEQLAIALDSARLYMETQRRAEQERLISQTSSRMRENLDVEAVIKTALNEIYLALGLQEMSVWLSSPSQTTGGEKIP